MQEIKAVPHSTLIFRTSIALRDLIRRLPEDNWLRLLATPQTLLAAGSAAGSSRFRQG